MFDRLGGGGGAASPGAPTSYAPVIGRVSMDQITIDLTDAPTEACRLGAEVELVGAIKGAPNHLPRLAESAGTISHELLTRVGARVERVYRFPSAVNAAPPAPAGHIAPVAIKPPQQRAAVGGAGGGMGGAAVAR
jgi:hypothetical protein